MNRMVRQHRLPWQYFVVNDVPVGNVELEVQLTWSASASCPVASMVARGM